MGRELELAQDLSLARSYGLCEGCRSYHGSRLDPAHRIARGMGGVHRAEAARVNHVTNLLRLCRTCHDRTEHADTWQECASMGWRLDRADDPAAVPALIHTVQGYGWWYLTSDGGYLWADLPTTHRLTRRS